jgi:hypothetical protein
MAKTSQASRAGDPVHAGDKALTWETPVQRGRVNRYEFNIGPYGNFTFSSFFLKPQNRFEPNLAESTIKS